MNKILLIALLSLGCMACERRVNKVEQEMPAAAFDDKSETEVDRVITKKIRDAIMAEELLNASAKTIKISTSNGAVTLSGQALTASEKAMAAGKVNSIDGVKKLDNQIEVVPAK